MRREVLGPAEDIHEVHAIIDFAHASVHASTQDFGHVRMMDWDGIDRDAGALRARASDMRSQAEEAFARAGGVPSQDAVPDGPSPEYSTPAGAAEGQGALPGKGSSEVPMPPDASVPAVPGQPQAPRPN